VRISARLDVDHGCRSLRHCPLLLKVAFVSIPENRNRPQPEYAGPRPVVRLVKPITLSETHARSGPQ
jgi:hypothetical protein